MWRLLLILTMVTGIARAEVLPPDVAALRAKVATAEQKLAGVKTQVEAAQRRERDTDAALRALVRLGLRAGGYPPGFWAARSVATGEPATAGLVARVVAQEQRELAHAQQQAGELAQAYGRMNAQLARVREVQAVYDDARGRLQAAEKEVLRDAGVEADKLTAAMDAMQGGGDVVPVSEVLATPEAEPVKQPVAPLPAVAQLPVKPGWPVTGRVARTFGSGEGAMRGGVVLKAPPHADVRAPLGGTVLYAGPFRQFGGLVILKTDNGDDMVLGGLVTLTVNADARVTAGQPLGTLNDDGRLYWEVRRRGRGIDPLRTLASTH